jgi:hypothetical protein
LNCQGVQGTRKTILNHQDAKDARKTFLNRQGAKTPRKSHGILQGDLLINPLSVIPAYAGIHVVEILGSRHTPG